MSQRKTFPDISYLSFQHPQDKEALDKVKKIPVLPVVFKALSNIISEKMFLIASLSDNLRITARQCPSLYKMFEEAANILSIKKLPELYLDSNYQINAFAFGMENFTITLYSGLVDLLTEDELMFVIAHELTHIKCEHMLYLTMAQILFQIGSNVLSGILGRAIGNLALTGLMFALYSWMRKAEFSCDRGGQLVVQNPEVSASALTKLAGGSQKFFNEINIEEVLNQAQSCTDMDEKLLWKAMKILQTLPRSHPFPIVRVQEILTWTQSEEYKKILAGEYLKTTEQVTISHPFTLPSQVVPMPATTPEIFFCPYCGNKIKKGYKFCSYCGEEINI